MSQATALGAADGGKRGYRMREAVEYTGRPRSHIYEAIRAGELRSYKLGAARWFVREDLDEWIDRLMSRGD
jgi:excisionase family DNA binding protein